MDYPDELLADVSEWKTGELTWERRMEIHRRWVVSGEVTPKEFLALVQGDDEDGRQ